MTSGLTIRLAFVRTRHHGGLIGPPDRWCDDPRAVLLADSI